MAIVRCIKVLSAYSPSGCGNTTFLVNLIKYKHGLDSLKSQLMCWLAKVYMRQVIALRRTPFPTFRDLAILKQTPNKM